MTRLRRIYRTIKAKNFHSHFAVELFLLLIVTFTVGANLLLRGNSGKATLENQSLFFSFLKNNPSWNERLVDAWGRINVKLGRAPAVAGDQILLAAASTINKGDVVEETDLDPLPNLSGSVLLKPNPAGSGIEGGRDAEVYVVQPGDTVGRIALSRGVSENTIIWENNLPASGLIRTGQELRILPVSGVSHTVKDGETISGIGKKYGVGSEDILEYNNIEIEEHIFPGEVIIIPDGVKIAPPSPQRAQYLADLQKEDYQKVDVPANYQGSSSGLIWPMPAAKKLSQSYSSRHRAIDVPCRDCEVTAAGDGIVQLAGWQTGYGNTVVINHGNGITTRYGHGKSLLVKAGDSVTQGQAIMISGSTGRSTGPHLHFEVKINGDHVDPLKYVPR